MRIAAENTIWYLLKEDVILLEAGLLENFLQEGS